MKIVIRCGGAGTRLWPMSRERLPKQFQPLLGQESLLAAKLRAVRPLLGSWNDLYVSTHERYVPIVRRLVPRLRRDHIIAEPVRRNTGPAIALETAVIAAHANGDDPVIASLTVDDVMRNIDRFRQLLRRAAQYVDRVDPAAVLTIGSPPAAPDPGLSYLVLGSTVERHAGSTFRRVRRWVEKPNVGQLHRLLRRGQVAAHTGLYVWRASTLLNLLAAHHPHLVRRLDRIRRVIGHRNERAVVRREFRHFPAVSIEELVARRAPTIVAGVADLGWSDTGKWFLVQELRRDRPGANVVRGDVVALDTTDSLIYAPPRKLVATVGLRGFVVVDTGDALLVCPKDRSGDVKAIVEHLQRTHRQDIL